MNAKLKSVPWAKFPKLSKIKLCEFASQETPCFEALLEYKGAKYHVSNSGTGGCNSYHPHLSHEDEKELDAWAAANNPPCEMEGCPPLPMNFETWTFGEVFGL